MRLLDLVEQHHGVRVLSDGVHEKPALVEAHVAGRRADEPRTECFSRTRSCRSG
jgi:hypothetical protein